MELNPRRSFYRMGLLALMVAPSNRAPQCPRRRIGIVALIA
jgi:hypothetical protein